MSGKHGPDSGTLQLSSEMAKLQSQVETLKDEQEIHFVYIRVLTMLAHAASTRTWFTFRDWIERGWPLSSYFFKRNVMLLGGGSLAPKEQASKVFSDVFRGFGDPKSIAIACVRGNASVIRLMAAPGNSEVALNPDIYGEWEEVKLFTHFDGEVRERTVLCQTVSAMEFAEMFKVIRDESRDVTLRWLYNAVTAVKG